MKIDYHIHTLCSDGIFTVEEVLNFIQNQGIQSFSITDHDTVSGTKTAKNFAAEHKDPLHFISGIEITCREISIPNVSTPFSIHLLGYGFDENNEKLLKRLAERATMSRHVFETLAGELSSLGYNTKIEDIPISCGNVLQLCDVSSYIQKIYAPKDETPFALIDSYASPLSSVNITPKEGITLIHGAGGMAVWAHPFCVYHHFQKVQISRQDIDTILSYLTSIGLDGLEADYLAFSETDRQWLRALAARFGCFYTAGSDFHGANGRDIMGVDSKSTALQSYDKQFDIL
ncbi:PHP domain-containing protein [Lachnoclostridium sp. An181]|uniref:PHP domain-containing protein n=1 Tax=Lachnoclostridium sp. An181 TaxID=1965575 RepID=UPI000B399087|nr:PHP domain-containing protein [Lachnoclostridium sp. An181]OUP50400.1 hypothetical protein B5F18_04265 [Lachnoclostridium sp. An181]